jgi:hypothetical protein
MEIRINKPHDGRDYYKTKLTCTTHSFPSYELVGMIRNAKDPVQAGLEEFWKKILSPRGRYAHYAFDERFNHIVMISGCPIVLSREGIRYHINGKPYSLATVCSAMARITYKSCFETDPAILLSSLYSTLSLPENVKYCMENRAPYNFVDDYEIIEVRLPVMQIGDKEMAIEISDGIWGTMSVKELDTYCNFYIHGKARGSWKRLSPENLYKRTLGRTPSESELKVMKAFLQQNRTRDLVEARALELVADMLIQHEGRLYAEYEGEVLVTLYVKGRDYDWKLTNNKFKSEIQMVSTYVWQPNSKDTTEKWDWKGPICIDNMAGNSPVGDQFATRALALLNDYFTITIVNTISNYLIAKPNTNRVDFDDMR